MQIFGVVFSWIAVTILAVGCNSGLDSDSTDGRQNAQPIPLLTNNADAETQTLSFQLIESGETDSSTVFLAKSLYKEDTVGLEIEVLKDIPAGVTGQGQVDGEIGFVQGAIRFSSIGGQSDALVKSLSDLFKLESSGTMTETTIDPLVFSSNNRTVDLSAKATYSFKLFLDNQEGKEAEVFAVLDTYRRVFEISEKDTTFRKNILSAFVGE